MISFYKTWKGCDFAKHGEPMDTFSSSNLLLISKVISSRCWSPVIFANGAVGKSNFQEAHFLALDFDESEMTVADAIGKTGREGFADAACIIGTTKNHQKEKNGKPPRDRFRVIIPFEWPITDLPLYEYTVRHYVRIFGADQACVDGARRFYPCTEIVHVNMVGDHAMPEPLPPAKPKIDRTQARLKTKFYGVSKATEDLIYNGVTENRNQRAFSAACELLEKGIASNQVYDMVFRNIPSTEDFPDSEKHKIIRSAERRVKS